MSGKEKAAVFADCLRQFKLPVLLIGIQSVLTYAVFRLYGVWAEPFLYVFALTCLSVAAVFVVRLIKAQKHYALRRRKLQAIRTEWNDLPAPRSLAEADYIRMAETLGAETDRLAAAFAAEQKETQDFYTVWVHQIKTPIAVMKLSLGASQTPDKRALQEELFRIEGYTDMALAFQRLGSSVNDLLIEEYALDALIREVIRAFAPQFIYKKLKLEYEGTDLKVVTDKKWFLCILEQLLSNALKYTPSGTITISVTDGVLTVADTGVGIAPEDLPRIFEKGYTGVNGRLDQSASGLGLYLCGKGAALLNIPISAESVLGQGSRFLLDLREKIIEG